MNDIRRPAVAGMFYPSNPVELSTMINGLLNKSSIDEKYKDIFGIVAPHAGYVYSGISAAAAYNVLKQKEFSTAVIISPSHREYFRGSCVYAGDAYQTPLGVLEVNFELRDKIEKAADSIFIGKNGHRDEHALEVQLPFLQSIKSNISILPIVIGDQSKKYVDELAFGLNEILTPDCVVIASTDLSHFHSKKIADKIDSVIVERINFFEYDELQNDLESNICQACGGGGIVSLMKSASLKNFKKAKVLSKTDSGDVSGDNSSVVGYLSAVIYN